MSAQLEVDSMRSESFDVYVGKERITLPGAPPTLTKDGLTEATVSHLKAEAESWKHARDVALEGTAEHQALTRAAEDKANALESRIRSARDLIKMFHEQYGDNGTVCAVLTLVDLKLGGES